MQSGASKLPMSWLNSKFYLILQALTGMGYELVSGGTDNHLVLVNLKNKVKIISFYYSLLVIISSNFWFLQITNEFSLF